MSIHRQHRKEGWAHLPNEPVEVPDLSFRAKGVLWYLLSRPDEWRPKGRHLATVSTEGRDAVYTARSELIAHGYLVETRERDAASGRFNTVTHVFDTPGHTAAELATGTDSQDPAVTSANAASSQVSAGTRNPDSGNSGSGPSGPLVITDGATTEQQEPLTLLPSAAADSRDEPDPVDAEFDGEFWPVYPQTNGRKPEKGLARKAWRKLTVDERERAKVGARHLALSSQEPKYAHRFLTRKAGEFPFDDWQAPPDPRAGTNGHATRRVSDFGDTVERVYNP